MEEDERLTQIVANLGTKDWNCIAGYMGSRNARQCRERWRNYLDPELRNGEWTTEEDNILQAKYMEMGAKWNKIAQFFTGRSDLSLRNRMQVLERRSARMTSYGEVTNNESSEVVQKVAEGEQTQRPTNPFSLLESLEPEFDFFAEQNSDPWGRFGF
jgi:hypothetical protein